MRQIKFPGFLKLAFLKRRGGGGSNYTSIPASRKRKFIESSRFFLLSVTSAFILTSIFIALPKTELLSDSIPFDLNVKEKSYWKRSYTLEVEIKNEDKKFAEKKLNETKDILHKRLRDYGVEEVRITDFVPEEVDVTEETAEGEAVEPQVSKRYIKVTVQSAKDQLSVESLIRNRTYIRLMLPKEGAFDNPEDQFAQLLPDNYTPTQFTRHDFRNVLIKALPTTTGETAYFAVYKVAPLSRSAWGDFLEENAGQTIGIAVDGLVYPYDVPFEFGQDLSLSAAQGTATRPDFAPGIAQTKEQAEISDLLYNSGVIPLRYSVTEQKDQKVEAYSIEYEEAALSILAGLIAVIIFSYLRYKERHESVVRYAFTLLLIYSFWLAILKFFNTPVDLFMLALDGMILIPLVKILTFRGRNQYRIEIGLLLILFVARMFTDGYAHLAADSLLKLSVAAIILIPLTNYYLNNMKKVLFK